MFLKSSETKTAPATSQAIGPLSPEDGCQVTGGPMGSPSRNNRPAGMRPLTSTEVRLVSGGPGGFPVLGSPPTPDQAR